MNCEHFGVCNACVNYDGGYKTQLKRKLETLKPNLALFGMGILKFLRAQRQIFEIELSLEFTKRVTTDFILR